PRSSRDVTPVDIDERPLARALLDGKHLAHEEGVLAGRHLRRDMPGQPADRPGEQWRSARLADVDPVPERDRRHPAREVLSDAFLARREQADAERPGTAQQLV